MRATILCSGILLAVATTLGGCERRDEHVQKDTTVETRRADRQAYTAKAGERLSQLDARIAELGRNAEKKFQVLTQQAKLTTDEDARREVTEAERKLRDKMDKKVHDIKRERNELKQEIDSLDMKTEKNWDDVEEALNEDFDGIEKSVDRLAREIEESTTKAIDDVREEVREAGERGKRVDEQTNP